MCELCKSFELDVCMREVLFMQLGMWMRWCEVLVPLAVLYLVLLLLSIVYEFVRVQCV